MKIKHQKCVSLSAGLALVATFAAARTTESGKASGIEVAGEVTLAERGSSHTAGEASKADASKVVVWLVSQDAEEQVRLLSNSARYRLVQHNKRFEPGLLVVPVGSTVDFPNLDPWFHNVFSLYRGKRFDLGLYQAGSQKSVKFDRPGPSYLFCNIHPEMTGVVLAIDSSFFSVSDKSGHYTIPEVPPGKYTIRVWQEYATPDTLLALQRPVVIDEENRTLPTINVAVSHPSTAEHKNKYGQDYDPNTLKTDY
jgi:plastocyanin